MPNFHSFLATLADPIASVLLSIASGILTAIAIATVTDVAGRVGRRKEARQLREIFARHEKQLWEASSIHNAPKDQIRYVLHRHFLGNTKLIVSVQMRHLTYEQRFDILELVDNRQHMMTELLDPNKKIPSAEFYRQFFCKVETLDWMQFKAENTSD